MIDERPTAAKRAVIERHFAEPLDPLYQQRPEAEAAAAKVSP